MRACTRNPGAASKWLQASTEITRGILAAAPDDAVGSLRLIADRSREVADADVVTIALPDGSQSADLRVSVAIGTSADSIMDLTVPQNASLSGRAFTTGKPLRLTSPEESPSMPYAVSAVVDAGPIMVVPAFARLRPRARCAQPRPAARSGRVSAPRTWTFEIGFASRARRRSATGQAATGRQRGRLEDRERIARDLHDIVIQRLFAAGMTLQGAAARVTDPDARSRVERAVDELDATIKEIRTAIFQLQQTSQTSPRTLRARVLDLVGELAPALGFDPAVRFSGLLDTLPDRLGDDLLAVVRALTERGAPMANPGTLQTSLPFLFVGGDFYPGPPDRYSGRGRRAAGSRAPIHQYLNGQALAPEKKAFNISRGELGEVDVCNFEGISAGARVHVPALPAAERVRNFQEAELGIEEAQAGEEANRCLSCGCLDGFDCRLRSLATDYDLHVKDLNGWKKPKYPIEESRPFVRVDANKCIACGTCVHGCSEYQIQDAFELWEAQEKTSPPPQFPFINDKCVSCGLCVANCPTGALQEKMEGKPGPFKLKRMQTTCTYCGVGCQIYLGVAGSEVVRVDGVSGSPPNFGHLCVKGRFGYHFIHHPDRLRQPLIRENEGFRQATWEEALDLVARRFQGIRDQYGSQALAALTSARATNEDNYVMQKFVRGALGTNNIDHCARL